MKKIQVIILMLAMFATVLTFSSCGEKSVDEQFKDAYIQGLDARWQLVYEDGQMQEDTSTNEDSSFVRAELEYIEKFKNETFENKNLGEFAKDYIKVLDDFLKTSDPNDKEKYHEEWGKMLLEREVLMAKMEPFLKVEFDDSVEQNSYESMVNEGKIIDLQKRAKFELTSEQHGTKEYSTDIPNITDINFKTFTMDIALMDKDDKTISTEHAFTTNWEVGTTHRFTFSTKKDFDHYELVNYNYTE